MIFSCKQTALIEQPKLKQVAQKRGLSSQIDRLIKARTEGYQTPYASINAPFDKILLAAVSAIVVEKQKLNPTVLVVVGIGGSSLGAKAVQEALQGRFYNAGNPILRIYFAQTVDPDRMTTILTVVETEIKKGNVVLINVVTKSGTTTETIANFQVLLVLLQKHCPNNYADYVIATTDKDSVLWNISKQEGFALLEVPQLVGGRYSVFTTVGLFPLMMIGIDVNRLSKGAQSAVNQCLDLDIFNNPAALGALITYIHYKNGFTIHDLFLFSVDFEGLGKWYRQLAAESLGKEKDIHGNKVLAGITPTVSLGSIDLHSVAQLYLGGPRDKLTTFVTIEKNQHKEMVPDLPPFSKTFPQLAQKSFTEIMHAIVEGTKTAYYKNKRPFCSIILPEKNAYYIGQFLQMKMIETIYLGHLMEVDPFDQPNVELYKKETRRLLAE